MTKTEAFSDDKLDRKVVAENFKNILLNTDLNVFSLVAPWGGGKTYFINNLIELLNKDAINILYNAWESDFYDSPLIPLLIELLAKIETYNKKDKLTEDISWSKTFAEKICKSTTCQAGINIGAINCSANFDPNVKMLDSEYMQLKSEIKTFRDKLQKIQKKLKRK